MPTEPVSFETHIKPMFRERDRTSMMSPSVATWLDPAIDRDPAKQAIVAGNAVLRPDHEDGGSSSEGVETTPRPRS